MLTHLKKKIKMTSVKSDETEILRRQIRYLTDLINNSGETSKIKITQQRPATYSHQRGTFKKHINKNEQPGQAHNKPTGKSETKLTSKFSWKKTSSHDKTVATRTQLEAEKLIAPDNAVHRTLPSRTNSVGSSSTSLGSSFESSKEVASSRYLSGKTVNLTTTNTNSVRKPSIEKSLSVQPKTGSENFQEDKNIDEKCFIKNDNSSSPLKTEISKKLRNHSFMNRSTFKISGSDTSCDGNKTPSVPSYRIGNPLNSNMVTSNNSTKEHIPVHSTERNKDTDYSSSKNVNNKSKTLLDGNVSKSMNKIKEKNSKTTLTGTEETSSTMNPAKLVPKSQDKNFKTTHTSTKESLSAKNGLRLVPKTQDKNSKTAVTSKNESSPTKKEVMEQLNRKLLETSNTILQLKKQLSTNSATDKFNQGTKVNVKTEKQVKLPTKLDFNTTTSKSSSVKNQTQSIPKMNIASSSTSEYRLSKTVSDVVQTYSGSTSSCISKYSLNKHLPNVAQTNSGTIGKDLTIKTRYSLKKIPTDTGSIGNPRPSELSNAETKVFSKHNIKEIGFSGPSTSTSFSVSQQIPFKSKYCLRKNSTPRTLSSNHIESSTSLKSLNNQKTNVFKSKYHFRKTHSLKLQNMPLPASHVKKRSRGQLRLPVFNSKYKFSKTTPKNSIHSFSPNTSNSPAIIKIIKSKYKLRKISQNFSQLPKPRKTPMKTIVKSKYKLRKVPANKASNSSSSSYARTRNQFYGNRNYPYYKNFVPWHYHKNKFRKYYAFGSTTKMYRQQKWTSQDRHYGASWHQYKGGNISYPAKAPLVINRKYVMKRIQNTTGTQTTHTNKYKLNKTDHQLVVINGMLYRSSGRSLVKANKSQTKDKVIVKKMNSSSMKIVKVRGVKFQMDSSGKTLKRLDSSPVKTGSNKPVTRKAVHRVDFGGMTFVQTKPGTLEQMGSNQIKVMASRMKHRSIVTATAKYKKDNTKKKIAKKYCMFYNRFGKCQRGDKCPFVHDPERVAVCTRFLRGTCRVDDCPFSHKTSKEKMPTCSYFLRGICNRDDCPYLHVNVSKTAKVCPDFIKGFCSLGEKCTKKHTLTCPSFSKTGTCTEVKPCKLNHIKKKQRYISPQKTESSQKDQMKLRRKPEETIDDSDIPFKQRKLPTYISITSDDEPKSTTEITESAVSAMKIRPQLGLK